MSPLPLLGYAQIYFQGNMKRDRVRVRVATNYT